MKGISIVNLCDLIEVYGEEAAKDFLLEYSCPLNKDVDYFLKKKAIEFSKQCLTQTHLVYKSFKDKPVLVGYYAISTKSILIDKNALSNTLKRRVSKFGTFDSTLKKYNISAQLIGQLGKNFHNGHDKLITGDELLKLACDTIYEAQKIIGGKIIYLECEDIPHLKEFYSSNGFVEFGNRKLDRDETDKIKGDYLVQMLKYMGKPEVSNQIEYEYSV